MRSNSREIVVFVFLLFRTLLCDAQSEAEVKVTSITTLTIINPGFEIERPISLISTGSLQMGILYGGSYRNLTTGFNSGAQVLIAPFADFQYRTYLNRKKRYKKGKNISNNSGSYLMLRVLIRGKGISSTFTRTSDTDFSVGIGWGFRKYRNRFGWSFSISPDFYFDDKGNSGFFPFVPELTIGYVLR